VKKIITLCLLAFIGIIQVNAQAPTISSFSPISGKPGDAITVTGTNFNTNTNNNIVFFGATRATVNAASATSLTVSVPNGATYAPITVLNTGSGLMAASNQRFTLIFSPSKSTFATTDMVGSEISLGGVNQPYAIRPGDIDGDGKVDLVQSRQQDGFNVLRNTSSGVGNISTTATGYFTGSALNFDVQLGDLNGDGKLDVVEGSANSGVPGYFINNSTVGSINFNSVAYLTGACFSMGIADLNGDGKQDITSIYWYDAAQRLFFIRLHRNTSTSTSSVSFSNDYDIALPTSTSRVLFADIDGDGGMDIIVGYDGLVSGNAIVDIYTNQNNSAAGFTASSFVKTTIDNGTNSRGTAGDMRLGDFDGDGKIDIATLSQQTGYIHILRNTSTVGSPSFASFEEYAAGNGPYTLETGDLTGDGKIDLMTFNHSDANFSILANNSSAGSINFLSKVAFTPTSGSAWRGTLADLDGDGKLDFAYANAGYPNANMYAYRYNSSISGNANLASLTLSSGTFSPTFAAAIIAYTAAANNSSVTVTPTLSDANASIQVRVNGGSYATVTSGSASAALSLNGGANIIDVKVTAQDGITTKIYTITVNNPALWTGAVNTNWSNTGNWEANTLPSATIAAIIPTGLTNYPVISSSTTAMANSITIQAGASLTLNSGSSLTIDGVTTSTNSSIYNLGTLHNNGTINIGTNSTIGSGTTNGINNLNAATVNNYATGIININRAYWPITNEGAINNSGKISIGGTASSGIQIGIQHGVTTTSSAILTNNIGGEINIDGVAFSSILSTGSGTILTNNGKITIGSIASAGGNSGIRTASSSIVTNNSTGEINIDRAGPAGILSQGGAFTNAGKINIGSIATGTSTGIQHVPSVSSNFTNTVGGEITINRVTTGIQVQTSTGSFINNGKINIGTLTTLTVGIFNRLGGIINNSGGEINIDRTTTAGIQNVTSSTATFTNTGKINIGANASVGSTGFTLSAGSFTNNIGGEIKIDRATTTGFSVTGGTVSNAGKITIGSIASNGATGLIHSSTIAFTNNSSGEITIDRSTTTALNITRTLNNSGKITIGANVSVGATGISHASSTSALTNNACGSIYVMAGDFTSSNGAVINNGYIQVNNTLARTSGTFTNNAVLKYGSLTGTITNTNNASVIVKNDPTPIFTYGGVYNGTINGIYTDAANTISAGSFTAPNSFVASSTIPGGLQTLYAKITPSGGACSYSVPFTYNAPYNITVCTSQLPYTWNGLPFNAAGTQTATLTKVGGGDSIMTLNLSVVTSLPAITGANEVCAGTNINLKNTVTGGVWSSLNNRVNIDATTGTLYGINAGTAVIKYSTSSCGSITKTLIVNDKPDLPSISYATGLTINPQKGAPTGGFCVGKTFEIVGTPSSPQGFWSSTGVVSITSGGIVTINAVGNGSVTYTYTNANGCSNSRTIIGNGYSCAARGVSINEKLETTNEFSMYPNPAKSVVNLQVDKLVGTGSIVITDLYGKAIKTQILSLGNNTINISTLSKGMYFVSMITSEGKTTKKLVVE